MAGGFSYGMDEQIQDLYIDVCSNYEPGDKIYIFGFSRGAVAARVLAGLLAKGILKPHIIHKLPDLWRAFSGSDLISLPKTKMPESGRILDEDYASRDPSVEFLGVFDTVSGAMDWQVSHNVCT
jgi:uncharacterized protein (DUF2235 family)